MQQPSDFRYASRAQRNLLLTSMAMRRHARQWDRQRDELNSLGAKMAGLLGSLIELDRLRPAHARAAQRLVDEWHAALASARATAVLARTDIDSR